MSRDIGAWVASVLSSSDDRETSDHSDHDAESQYKSDQETQETSVSPSLLFLLLLPVVLLPVLRLQRRAVLPALSAHRHHAQPLFPFHLCTFSATASAIRSMTRTTHGS